MREQPFRLVFMGTPEFAVPSLEVLCQRSDLVTVLGVYTQPDKPTGRGNKITSTPVKMCAQKYGIPVLQPENLNEPSSLEHLQSLQLDYIIVAAYAQFLGSKVLATPTYGCLNVHASLLPKYRGAAPVQYALLNGEKETGISIIRLVKKMDAGPILRQSALPITEEATTAQLLEQLAESGAKTLIETLENPIMETPQNEDQATYAKKILKEDGRISWEQNAEQILNQIRAFDPWPGTFVQLSSGILKVKKARVGVPPLAGFRANQGQVFVESGTILVRCLDYWLELLEVQLEGRKTQSAREFLNGYKQELRFV